MENLLLRDYLLNLLFIYLSLFLLQLWIQKKSVRSERSLKIGVFLFSALGVFLCTTFPVRLNDDYIFDLRDVPLWIGGLYGGPFVSGLLFLFNVLYRSLYGGWGILSTFIGGGVIAIVSGYFSSRFLKYSTRKKISFVMIGAACSTLIIFMMAWSHVGFFISWIYWVEAIVVLVVSAGIITYSAETVRNHVNLQEYVVHNDKWESISHLSASISHEIRNKVTTSKGFLQFFINKETDQNKREYFEIALKELSEAEKIIQDYLSFAKPNPNQMEELNIEEEVIHMSNIVRPLSKLNSVSIDLITNPYMVKGDRSLFRQALLNMMKNAIEAMPNGGKLQLIISGEENNAVLEIVDNGIGMNFDQISRLGEPYFSTKGSEGTGLGMMVVYRIIEEMKGSIDVRSELGKGTKFVIKLPLADFSLNPVVNGEEE